MSDIERAIEGFENELRGMKNSAPRHMAKKRQDRRTERINTALTVLRAELSRQENAPLTWDEVVASEGKPVFIYGLEGEHGDDGWSIVGEKYERSGFTFVNLHDKNITNCGLDDLYGKTWIAYRYEPKGEPTCTQD